MTVRALFGVLAAFVTCLLAQRSAADDLKAAAAFTVGDREVNWVALSPDGTRLAASAHRLEPRKDKKGNQSVGGVTFWNLATSAQVSTPENANAGGYLFFSADGKTLITSPVGFNNEGGNVWLGAGLRTRGGYRAWDATTGKEIGSIIAPALLGEFSTAAVSPDGKYLVTVFNSQITIERDILKPFPVRELVVWDLQQHKAKWKLPGATHVGRVTWSDSLAFSPDGKKLAFAIHGSGGPSSESTVKARPDRPDANLSRLKMLTLEEGKEAPAVEVLELSAPIKGDLQWVSGGKFLVGRGTGSAGRLLEVHDAATGKHKDTFALQFPPPAPKGKGLPLPPPPPNSTDVPEGWYETYSVLSADGTRLAAHFYRSFEDRTKPWQNRVGVWDVPGRKLLGLLALPESRFVAADFAGSIPRTDVRIALSGNGAKLAVGQRRTVNVYDVSKISGLMKAVPGDAAGKDPGEAATVRKTYETAVAKARQTLLEYFDETITRLEKAPKLDKALVARLKEAKERFAKNDALPWSEQLWKGTSRYLNAVAEARNQVFVSYGGTAAPPAELRDLVDKRVIARWTHQPAGGAAGKITLYSSGKINDPAGEHAWSFADGRLTLRWKDPKAPGGFWVDTCALASDGLSYTGQNQNKTKVTGTLVKDE